MAQDGRRRSRLVHHFSVDLSTYDASYLELAMRDGLSLVTQDERMRAAAGKAGVALAV